MTIRLIPSQGSGRNVLGGFPRGTFASHPKTALTEDGDPDGPQREIPFLGQVSLREVQDVEPIEWLPDQGLLFFFWDLRIGPGGYSPAHSSSWHVHFEPKEPDEPIEMWPQSWPESEEAAFMGEPARVVVGMDIDDESGPRLLVAPELGEDPDRILLTAQLAANGIDTGDDVNPDEIDVGEQVWRVLLQLEPFGGLDFDDAFDRLYFLVEEERAREGDFNGVWAVVGYDE